MEEFFFKCWVSIENSYPIEVNFFIPCTYSSYLFFVTSVFIVFLSLTSFCSWLVSVFFTYWYWFWSSRMRISHNYTLDIMCLIHLWSVHCQNPSSLSSIGYQRFARVKYIAFQSDQFERVQSWPYSFQSSITNDQPKVFSFQLIRRVKSRCIACVSTPSLVVFVSEYVFVT